MVALALHRQALQSGLDSWFLGALEDRRRMVGQGTRMLALTGDSRENALFAPDFDMFALSQPDAFGFLKTLGDYLLYLRPDVVHIHHLLNFGLESLHLIRRILPQTRIVLTLHDYFLICANEGKMFRPAERTRCPGPSLGHCMACMPERSAIDFAMRRLDIANALSLSDHLVSPSWFLKGMFDRALGDNCNIEVIENGYLGEAVVPAPSAENVEPVFGYFGNVSVVKGLGDLLDAVDILAARGLTGFSVDICGSQLFDEPALSARIAAAKAANGQRIRFRGAYAPDDVAGLIAGIDCVVFPSIWWENAPLVIYETLFHNRQVIAYPHGGAPEILARYGMGVLAGRSDPMALADAMARVLAEPALTRNQPARPVPGRAELLAAYQNIYLQK
jgi:glycosyltransferase involved in cell wall biosynthesis